MDRPVVLITGANTGLGLETVNALFRSSRAYTILLGTRNKDNADAAVRQLRAGFPNSVTVVAPVQVDLEKDLSIAKAFDFVAERYGRVDVLINNAGGQFDPQVDSADLTMREMWNKSWDVNTTGTHILTHTFVPLLLKSFDPRLLFITSGTSSLTESENLTLRMNKSPTKGRPKTSPSITAYRASKTGMNMLMREWARILHQDRVKTWCVSPGFLATGLGGNGERNKQMGLIDLAIGANLVRDVVEGARDGDVGKVVRRDGVQPW